MQRADCSNKGLASRVRAVAAQHGVDLRCNHVDVKRWKEGRQPRDATAKFIAKALSQKMGSPVSVSDIGMGDVGPDPVEESLKYPQTIPDAWRRLSELTRIDLAGDPQVIQAEFSPEASTQPLLQWLLARPTIPPQRSSRPLRVGDADVRAVSTTFQLFQKMDFELGGGHSRAALAQYFTNSVLPLLDGQYTAEVGRGLFCAAAEVAELLGWASYDSTHHGLAQRYWIQALRLAQASGDRVMGGYILASMSHQATYLGNFDQAVEFARAAQEGARTASATTQAAFLAMEARGHAGAGNESGCSEALSHAEKIFGRRNPEEDPEYIGYFDEAELAGEGAHCFRDLQKPVIAQEFLDRAVSLCDPSHGRALAFVRLVHAATQVQQREPIQATQTAIEAIELAGALKSQRYLRYIQDLCVDLRPYVSEVEVRLFGSLIGEKYPAVTAAKELDNMQSAKATV